MADPSPPAQHWRHVLHEVIFEADTPIGKVFYVTLLVAILLSVAVVIIETVEPISARFHGALLGAEWVFTILFTVEYVLRLSCVKRPLRYAFSFFGIVDLLAILPTYMTLFFGGAASFIVIRALRLLRVFRVFKLARYLSEAKALRRAVWASRAKVTVFITAMLIVVVIMGTAMHLVEGTHPAADGVKDQAIAGADAPEEANGFDSIPSSMYWAIVTMTTVGYGDIAPRTSLGRALAALIMVIGYSFIIIPTGIISAEFAKAAANPVSTQVCPSCTREGHEIDAAFCKFCGHAMETGP